LGKGQVSSAILSHIRYFAPLFYHALWKNFHSLRERDLGGRWDKTGLFLFSGTADTKKQAEKPMKDPHFAV